MRAGKTMKSSGLLLFPLRVYVSKVIAVLLQRAVAAPRMNGLAAVLTELDEQLVELAPSALGNEAGECLLGLLGRFRVHQAQAVGDAVHVRVHRNHLLVKGKAEHAVRGLSADAGKRGELFER